MAGLGERWLGGAQRVVGVEVATTLEITAVEVVTERASSVLPNCCVHQNCKVKLRHSEGRS
jgi:hypothetical protein